MIADLPDFAQVQSGALSVAIRTERIEAAVVPAIEMIKGQANSKKIRLEQDIPLNLPEASCDKFRIGQVLSNLIGNAIKFTSEGGTIRVV